MRNLQKLYMLIPAVIAIIITAGCGVSAKIPAENVLTAAIANLPEATEPPDDDVSAESDADKTAAENETTSDGAEADIPAETDGGETEGENAETVIETASEPQMPDSPPAVRGIYVSSNRAGIRERLQELIDLCNSTALNAMVIDVKTDDGFITFKNEIAVADEMGVSVNNIPDVRGMIETLNENGIYPIARIVAFKDNTAHKTQPGMYIKNPDGSIWRDGSSMKSGWLNPYDRESWEYIIEIAKGAAAVGFREIQFDYIRFDTSSRLKDADFGDTRGKTRTEIIMEFARYAMDELRPLGVYVSADVYGTVINSDLDASIVGQDYAGMAAVLDYISPMIYPSHYADGSMGIEVPDMQPYDTVFKSLELSGKRLESISEDGRRAVVRPWLQDFTASWLKRYLSYTGDERRDQIQAVYDAGYNEWLLWDASVSYDSEGIFER